MRLISAILGFVLKKAALVGVMVVAGFLTYLVFSQLPDVQQAQKDLAELDRIRAEKAVLVRELDSHVDSLTRTSAAAEGKLERQVFDLRSAADDRVQAAKLACGLIARLERILPGRDRCKEAQEKAEAATVRLRAGEQKLAKAKERLAILGADNLSSAEKLARLRQDTAQTRELKQLEVREHRLAGVEGSRAGRFAKLTSWLAEQWAQAWKPLLWISLIVILVPPFWRTVSYFVLMPLVSRTQKPLQLSAGTGRAFATLQTGPAERTLPIRLSAGEVLSARSEYVRPVQGKVQSQILYDWRSPFISFAAGLYGLSRITGDEGGTEATLATPDDPNSYLMRIDFEDHPGVVMHPKHVVGVLAAPELETRWRWGIQSLATWQVRYIMFAGTGSLIVQGSGDVVATTPGDNPTRMEQDLMMGFDARLTVGVNRTEVFWPYLWGKALLVDDEFTGRYPIFWQKSRTDEASNPLVKGFNAVFSALGKLLGF